MHSFIFELLLNKQHFEKYVAIRAEFNCCVMTRAMQTTLEFCIFTITGASIEYEYDNKMSYKKLMETDRSTVY